MPDFNDHKTYKAALYARLSVEDLDKMKKGDESASIQNQRLLLTDYAMRQGWTIYNVYVDDDYSGLDRNRPAFNEMIRDAEKGEFDIILCKTLSRFTRDMELVEKYIHGRFLMWGIRFVGLVDNVDTEVKGNKKARQIYGLINEWYCEDLSDNIRSVFRKKMQDGQFLGAFAPYGYQKSAQDRHKLEIDGEAAAVVREIFSMYLDGHGSRQIADKLTKSGVLTPTLYKQSKGLPFASPNADKYAAGHGVWASNTIRKILQNETYIGSLIQGREKKVSYKSRKVVVAPQSEWVIVKNNHKPVIDEKTFYDVQTLIKNRRIHRAPKDGRYKGTAQAHVLAGKVRCADCGHLMTRSATGRNGEKYLRCSLYHKTQGTSQKCAPHTIKLDLLIQCIEERIRVFMDEHLSDDSEKAVLRDYCMRTDALKQQIAIKEKELVAIKQHLNKLEKAIADTYVDKSSGLLSEKEFLSIKCSLHAKMKELSEKQSDLISHIAELKNKLKTPEDAEENLNHCLKFESLTHAMANDFIDHIEIGTTNPAGEQKITIHWRF